MAFDVALSADDIAFLAGLFDPERVRGGQYGALDVRSHAGAGRAFDGYQVGQQVFQEAHAAHDPR